MPVEMNLHPHDIYEKSKIYNMVGHADSMEKLGY